MTIIPMTAIDPAIEVIARWWGVTVLSVSKTAVSGAWRCQDLNASNHIELVEHQGLL